MQVLEKTIRNGRGFERVGLDPAELREVQRFVMDFNVAVVDECIKRVNMEFQDVEPERRLHIALLLADKACIHSFTVHSATLSAKIAAIKDAMNGNGVDTHA